jgi:hypothetical protein
MPGDVLPEPPRDLAHLVAYDAGGRVVLELRLSFGDYYQELHPLIDSSEFRAKRGIARVMGRLFDSRGTLTQEFECHYSATGQIIRSTARHDDGTVTEFPASPGG